MRTSNIKVILMEMNVLPVDSPPYTYVWGNEVLAMCLR